MANSDAAPTPPSLPAGPVLRTHGAGAHSPEHALASVEAKLVSDFGADIPSEVIHAHVREAASGYAQARITTYVPVLVDRAVRARLRVG